MKNVFVKICIFSAVSLTTACSIQKGGKDGGSVDSSSLGSSSSPADNSKEATVSFKLTDAPNKALKSVIVNIDHLEVVVAGRGKAGRLILSKDLGAVDLLTLQNGVTLPLQDVIAPDGLAIQQIRLVLKEDGHYAIKENGSVCELKTPSAQKSGVKIILTNKVQFEAGHQYNIVVDFDALKSVVVQGNGGCLLKPVLKLKSATKKPCNAPDSGSGSGGTDDGNVGTDPGSSGGSETDDSAGEELVTTPEENDPAVDDGWDVGYPENEYPIIDEDDLRYRM